MTTVISFCKVIDLTDKRRPRGRWARSELERRGGPPGRRRGGRATGAAAAAAGAPGAADRAEADAVGEGRKILENQAQEVPWELLPRRRHRRRRHLQMLPHQQRNFSTYVSSLPIKRFGGERGVISVPRTCSARPMGRLEPGDGGRR
jgi:hypothetical protein